MKPYRILGLETSSPRCDVAVLTLPARPRSAAEALRTGRVAARSAESEFARHSDVLYDLLDGALRAARCRPADLDGVAVSLGPGSFTGLRVGLAAAKVFARFGGIGLAGIPAFEAVALEAAVAGPGSAWVPTLDARRGEVYAAVYVRSGDGVRARGPVRVVTPEALARVAPAGAPTLTKPPRAGAIAALGAVRLRAGRGDDPGTLVPLYVRRPEAVERRLAARRRGR